MEFNFFFFSVPLLCHLLEGRLSRLHGQIQRLVQQGCKEIDKVLGDLYEDIHWLLLISGNVLTLDTDGETSLIPPEIMRYSLGKAADVNVEATLRNLASPGEPSSSIPGIQFSCLFTFISCLFTFIHYSEIRGLRST